MKKVKIKIQQCGSESLGFTYRVEQITNAMKVEVTPRTFAPVGSFLTLDQVDGLCHNREYEVTVNAIKE